MAHSVKCMYCGKSFDRDIIPFKQIGRRYAHFECYIHHEANKTQDEKDKEDLESYIMKLFNESFINAKIKKQIAQYRSEYNYTYSGIRKALVYAFEVKKNDLKKANGGIGIVPFVYKDAYNYYYSLWVATQKNAEKDLSEYIPQQVEVHIPVPTCEKMRRKRFSFLDEEEIDGK